MAKHPQARMLVAVLAAAIASAVISSGSANSASSTGVGQRFDDGLDSRHAATSFIAAANAVGYAGAAWTSGRSADSAWSDAMNAQLIGYFGHANAGLFQVYEGATDATDEFIAAGLFSDLVSIDAGIRWWAEYLPFTDVDDVRVAVMAGCYTANDSPSFGQFSSMGIEKGIDSIVGFADLVYYPASCTSCAYSGNYFWERFSLYAKSGDTVATALSKARTDLVALEGNAGGWDGYRIDGSVASPGSVKFTPAGAGTGFTSQPFGLDPYSLASLQTARSTAGSSPLGETIDVETAQGVTYRLISSTNQLLDLQAPASTEGPSTLSVGEAEAVARGFAANDGGIDIDGWKRVRSGATEHTRGESLAAFEWRQPTSSGVEGPASVVVEVDRRTGSVTYFAHTWANPTSTSLVIARNEAIAAALRVADATGGQISASASVWDEPRWTVSIDRGVRQRVPDVDLIVIDGRTGAVISKATA